MAPPSSNIFFIYGDSLPATRDSVVAIGVQTLI
jgi:hypothetical protein